MYACCSAPCWSWCKCWWLKTYLQQKWAWQYAQNLEQGHCYLLEKVTSREAVWYSTNDAKEYVLTASETTTMSRPLLFGCLPFVIPPGSFCTLLLRASLRIYAQRELPWQHTPSTAENAYQSPSFHSISSHSISWSINMCMSLSAMKWHNKVYSFDRSMTTIDLTNVSQNEFFM